MQLPVFSFMMSGLLLILMASRVAAATIALSLPLGGDAAPLAKQFLAGAELAMERLGTEHDLFVADDGCSAEISQLAALDIARHNPAIVTGLLCNEPAKAAARRFAKTGIPILVAGARSVRLIKDRDREEWNLWRLSPGDDDPARVTANAIVERWKQKPFALVDDGSIYGRTYIDNVRQELEKLETKPQFFDTFRTAQSSQARLLRRLERSGVTAAFVAATQADDLIVIAKNLKKLDVNLEIMTSEALAVLPYIKQPEETAPGIRVVMQSVPATLEPAVQNDRKEIDPVTHSEQFLAGYAAIEVSLAALGATPQDTTQNLSSMEFTTIQGPVRFDDNGRNVYNPYSVFLWDGNKLQFEGSKTKQSLQTQ